MLSPSPWFGQMVESGDEDKVKVNLAQLPLHKFFNESWNQEDDVSIFAARPTEINEVANSRLLTLSHKLTLFPDCCHMLCPRTPLRCCQSEVDSCEDGQHRPHLEVKSTEKKSKK